MFLFSTVRFEGDRGRHLDQNGQQCAGRAFDIKIVGAGAVCAKTVVCTWCQRQLRAYHDALAPEPAPEFLAFV